MLQLGFLKALFLVHYFLVYINNLECNLDSNQKLFVEILQSLHVSPLDSNNDLIKIPS